MELFLLALFFLSFTILYSSGPTTSCKCVSGTTVQLFLTLIPHGSRLEAILGRLKKIGNH
jgi:hypothetical protein